MLRDSRYRGEIAGAVSRGDILKSAAIVSMASVVTAAYVAYTGAEHVVHQVKTRVSGLRNPHPSQLEPVQTSKLTQGLDGLGVEW